MVFGIDGKQFDASVNARNKNSCAVRRENDAGIAKLGICVRLEYMSGGGPGVLLVAGRQVQALFNGGRDWIEENQLMSLSRDREQLSVRAQSERLGAQPGQFELPASGSEQLIYRRGVKVRTELPDGCCGRAERIRLIGGLSSGHNAERAQGVNNYLGENYRELLTAESEPASAHGQAITPDLGRVQAFINAAKRRPRVLTRISRRPNTSSTDW